MAFPGTYNFNYYRGDTNEFVISPKNSDGTTFQLEMVLTQLQQQEDPLEQKQPLKQLLIPQTIQLCALFYQQLEEL